MDNNDNVKLTKLAKCAGCGAKVGAGVLAGLLCFIQLMTNGRVIELPYVGGVRLLPDLDE